MKFHLTFGLITILISRSNCKENNVAIVNEEQPNFIVCKSAKEYLEDVNYKVTFYDKNNNNIVNERTNERRDLADQGVLVFIKTQETICFTNGDDSYYISIFVNKPTMFDDKRETHEKVYLDLNEDNFLPCEPNGIPKPKITWFFNNKDIENSPVNFDYNITDDGLIITNGNKNSIGKFKCEAEQTLYQHGHVKKHTAKKHFNVKDKYAPITKIKTKKVKAQREKEIVLKCEVEAEPHPEFKWSHHHHVLKNVQSHGFSSNLTLLISEDDEFGKYICKAKNELGHVEVVFNVEEGVEEVTTLKPQKEPSTTTKASKPSIAIEITPFLFVTIIIPLLTSVILN